MLFRKCARNLFDQRFFSNRLQPCEKFSIQPQIRICINQYTLHCTTPHYTIQLAFPRYSLHLSESDSLCLCGAFDVCLENSKLKVKHFQLQIVKIVNLCVTMLLFVYECFKMENCRRNPLR